MNSTRGPWTVTAMMAAATFTSMFALTTLLETMSWLRTVLLVLLVVAAADVAVRAVTRSRFLPTLAALGAALVVMVPLFAMDGEGGRHLLPTPAALGDLWQAFVDGADYAASTPAPATLTTPLLALLTLFAVAIFVVADHLAASWRAVAVAGIVLLLPWTPAIFLQYRVPMVALFATAALWMLAMGATRSAGTASHRHQPLGGAVIASAAALVATLLVVPAALGANGWGAIPRFNTPESLDASTRLNLDLDLRKSLTVNTNKTVMQYVTTGRHPDSLRLYTYVDFDGSSWKRPKADPEDAIPVAGDVLWPLAVNDWDSADHVILSMDVTAASERSLPVPPVPRTVDVGDGWTYSPSWDEVSSKGAGTKGIHYTVVADLGYFTKESLVAAQPAIVAGAVPEGTGYTAVPASVDLARLHSLATQLTADATTQYDQAVAIQGYLRDTSVFTYDTSVSPAGSGDSVSQFLDDKRGYCVQFASAMVMLSRSIGIPARLAVGYLGGHLVDGEVWHVRGGDAHAWPELYFPGEGWVRFEPTPAIQTGAPPSYADPALGQGTTNGLPANIPVPTTVPTSVPQMPGMAPTSAPQGATDDVGTPWWAIVVVVLVLGGIGVLAWALRRRSVAKAAAHGPEAAWASLRERLPAELRWPLTRTPHEAAAELAKQLDTSGRPLTAAGNEALTMLVTSVSDYRYAPTGSAVDEAELSAGVRLVAEEAVPRSRPDRADAQSAPRPGS